MPIEMQRPTSWRSRYQWLALAMVAATVLQAVIAWRAYSINVDGLEFIGIARGLQVDPAGTMRDKDQHPGYPLLILGSATALKSITDLDPPQLWTLAALLAAGVCGVLSLIPMWLFARRLFDQQVADITVLSFAALPLFRMNAADALSDSPHLLLYLTAAWLAARGFADGRVRDFALAGAASGAAFWMRPEGLEIVCVTSLLLGIQILRREWRAAGSMVAVATAAMVVVTPYIFLAGKVTSKQLPFAKKTPAPVFVLEETQAAQRQANRETAAAVPVPAPVDATPAPASATAAAKPAAPANVAKHVAAKIFGQALMHFLKNMVWGFRFVFVPLYLIGNWALVSRRPAWWVVALPACLGGLHVAVLFGVYFLSGYIDQRHVMPLVALALPFAALGIVYVAERLAVLMAPRVTLRAAVASLVAVSCLTVLPRGLMPMNPELKAVFAATQWVKTQTQPGQGVLSNSPYVSFYAEMPGAFLCPETASLDAALARSTPARYEYAVLDLQIKGYREEWRQQIEEQYERVLSIDDQHFAANEPKVLVYRALRGTAADAGPTSEETLRVSRSASGDKF